MKRHGYTKKLQEKLDSNRQASEDQNRVLEYFQKLQKTIEDEGIIPEDIWNMDETGFRIGIGKDQLIVTKRKRAHLFSMPENRESATAIEAISAGGSYIPAFLILSGQVHMSNWYQQPELEDETIIALSSTGYSNDEISLKWIQHFNKYSRPTGLKRLLILDGHSSHHTIEFIEFCESHKIILFAMPPHLTHLLQPLDVVVFQPLKHYHAKALDLIVRDGVVNITKLEFLGCIQGIRKQAFKKTTILSAFKKTGISPWDPQLVLKVLASRAPARTPSPPTLSNNDSSNFSTPHNLRQINKVADKLDSFMQQDETLDEEFSHDISRFIRGSLILATELVQTKRDLGRTKKAEEMQRLRRAFKNKPLKSGGILTVAQGRQMVQQKANNDLKRAQQLVKAAEQKQHNYIKKVFFEATKTARRWRIEGRIQPYHCYDSITGYSYRKCR